MRQRREYPPIKDRRFVFQRRVAAGISPRAAAKGLGLDSWREMQRPEVQAAILEAKDKATAKAAEKLERKKALEDANSRALGAPGAAAVSRPASTDVLPTPATECVNCHIALFVGQKRVTRGHLVFCQLCSEPRKPEDYAKLHQEGMFAARLVAGPEPPIETGTYSEEAGYVRDLTESERAATIARIRDERANRPRTAWLPGQQEEM
jgi:hypothetical protein